MSNQTNTSEEATFTANLSNLYTSAQTELEEQTAELLIYGSGGSPNESDDVHTAISTLTVQYMSDLCEAAIRNHETMVGPMHMSKESLEDGGDGNTDEKEGGSIIYPMDFGVDVVDADAGGGVSDDDVEAHLRIGSDSFIRAVMHDRMQYGRVKEVLSSRKSIGPALLDQTFLSAVKDEVGDNAEWPGAENLLPLHE